MGLGVGVGKKPVRVLIVDDSAAVRRVMADILDDPPEIEVMATASDPFVAARRIQEEVPDVIVLDVEMPRMDGITFLRRIMAQRPIPVIICSSLTEEGSETLLQALEAGAIDIIAKPRADTPRFLMEAQVRVRDAVKAAARARVSRARTAASRPSAAVEPKLTADAMLPPPKATLAMAKTTERVVCIGASTGGTESLRQVLSALPADSPGIVVVQHMPEKFTAAFARRLDSLCAVEVKEAEDGDAVLPGRVLIAPGNYHMLLNRSGARYRVVVKEGTCGLPMRSHPPPSRISEPMAQAASSTTGRPCSRATARIRPRSHGMPIWWTHRIALVRSVIAARSTCGSRL